MNSKPSKSAKKREHLALQVLGERMISLSHEQLMRMPIEEKLRDAVIAAKSLGNHHGALRRQKQLIGKLMRDTDPAPVQAALDAFGATDRQEKAVFHAAEAWRDRIVSGGTAALAALFEELGYRDEAVASAAADHAAARHDKARREAHRRTFREIHRALSQKMQSVAGKA